jgi:hypothetical protein
VFRPLRVAVAEGRAEGRFKVIQIKVEHGALEMFDVRVTKIDFKYGNLPGGGNAQVELWAK